MYIVDQLTPGESIERRIEISSTMPTAADVDVYAAGATITDGAFIGMPDHEQDELSRWVTLSPGALSLSPGLSATATMTLRVPADVTPGEHYGVVWAEVRSAPSLNGGITSISRTGIRLYVFVGEGGIVASDFVVESLLADRLPSGQPRVRAIVRNTGGRALDLTGTLNLSNGPSGVSAGPYVTDVAVTVGVGARETVVVLLDSGLPSGPWDATMLLRSGVVEHRAAATLTFPDDGVVRDYPIALGPPGWLWPLVGALVVGLIMGAHLLRTGHRRPTTDHGRTRRTHRASRHISRHRRIR